MNEEVLAVDEFILEDAEKACLQLVVTVREAMAMYHKSHKTITALVKEGKLVGRQAEHGSTWLISKVSLDARWGRGGL